MCLRINENLFIHGLNKLVKRETKLSANKKKENESEDQRTDTL